MKTRSFRFILLVVALVTAGGALLWAAREKPSSKQEAGRPDPERRVVIRAKPHWIEKWDSKWLVLPNPGGDPLEIYSPVTTLPDKELQFTVWISQRVLWRNEDGTVETAPNADLDAIRDGGQVYFDAGLCEVHQRRMTRGEVEIHYGLLAITAEEWKTYSGGPGWVGGGCVVMEDSPRTMWGYRCDRCVAAYTKISEERMREWERRQASEAKVEGSGGKK